MPNCAVVGCNNHNRKKEPKVWYTFSLKVTMYTIFLLPLLEI